MNGTELISFFTSNFPAVMTAVGAIAGSLITVIFLRRNTSVKEFEKIKAGLFKKVADELLENGKMTYTEYFKANNFLTVAKKADEYYSKSTKSAFNGPYDFDWYVRFYEAVGNVSNERMQEIWAKILAGEINYPGSFSLRTIDVLKNIGQKDAELFEKICSSSISIDDHIFVPFYQPFLDKNESKYSEIMRLDELGLINSNGMLVLKMNISTEKEDLFHNTRLLLTAKSANEKETAFEIKQFPFTNVGRELSCTQTISTSDESFTVLAKELNKDKRVILGLHRVFNVCADQIQHDDNNLLETETD